MITRTNIAELPKLAGQTATIKGWVNVRRDHGKLAFFEIRDASSMVQAVYFRKGEKLDETITENTELKSVLAESNARSIFEELASDLALTQQEKFAALVEGIEFDGNFETYEKKLKIVKESYFKNDSNSYSTNFEEETFEGDVGQHVAIDPQINRYLTALNRTVKK